MTATFRKIALIAAAGVLPLLASPAAAQAQQVCVMRDAAAERLEKQFGERVQGRGLANAGQAMFELFVGEKGSWTMVVSDPKGRSCVIASGDNWQQLQSLRGEPVAARGS